MKLEPYILREYDEMDLLDDTQFYQDMTCYLCGHHLPVDQTVQLTNGNNFHSDPRICEALIRLKGYIYGGGRDE